MCVSSNIRVHHILTLTKGDKSVAMAMLRWICDGNLSPVQGMSLAWSSDKRDRHTPRFWIAYKQSVVRNKTLEGDGGGGGSYKVSIQRSIDLFHLCYTTILGAAILSPFSSCVVLHTRFCVGVLGWPTCVHTLAASWRKFDPQNDRRWAARSHVGHEGARTLLRRS